MNEESTEDGDTGKESSGSRAVTALEELGQGVDAGAEVEGREEQ